jgi:hypothetical protein
MVDALEAIVCIDGSRPTFLITNGIVDRTASPATPWSDTFDASSNLLKDATDCVGRPQSPGTWHAG